MSLSLFISTPQTYSFPRIGSLGIQSNPLEKLRGLYLLFQIYSGTLVICYLNVEALATYHNLNRNCKDGGQFLFKKELSFRSLVMVKELWLQPTTCFMKKTIYFENWCYVSHLKFSWKLNILNRLCNPLKGCIFLWLRLAKFQSHLCFCDIFLYIDNLFRSNLLPTLIKSTLMKNQRTHLILETELNIVTQKLHVTSFITFDTITKFQNFFYLVS